MQVKFLKQICIIKKNLLFCGLRPFSFMLTVFPLEVLYPEHLQLAFLELLGPGIVQGCKAPNGVE